MKKQILVLLLCTAIASLFLGCGGESATETPAPIPATAISQADPTDAPTAASSSSDIVLLERLLPDAASRVFRYAGAQMVIQDASISNRDTIDPNRIMPGNPWARLTFKITNPLEYPVTLPTFQVKFADGTGASGLDGVRVNKGETIEPTLMGPVKPETQWEGAVLTLSQADKEPLEIPLTGAVPTSEYPIELKPAAAVTAVNKYDQKIQGEVTGAQLDIDGVVGGSRAERAPLGKRFVHVNAAVTNQDAASGISIGSEYLQLLADGAAAEPAFDESGAKTVAPGETAQVSVWFLVPAAAKEFKAVIAPDGKQVGEILLAP